MRQLARLFSGLTLVLLIWAGWLMLAPQQPVVTPPPPDSAALTGPVDRIEIPKALASA